MSNSIIILLFHSGYVLYFFDLCVYYYYFSNFYFTFVYYCIAIIVKVPVCFKKFLLLNFLFYNQICVYIHILYIYTVFYRHNFKIYFSYCFPKLIDYLHCTSIYKVRVLLRFINYINKNYKQQIQKI